MRLDYTEDLVDNDSVIEGMNTEDYILSGMVHGIQFIFLVRTIHRWSILFF